MDFYPLLGTDIVEIQRIRRWLSTYPHKLSRIFSSEELRYARSFPHPEIHLAGMIAGKEAVFKILSPLGFSPLRFPWIEIRHYNERIPYISFSREMEKASTLGTWRITLSHTKEYALAIVLLLQEKNP
jgi:holo-[acyl-carrier protein] synthase